MTTTQDEMIAELQRDNVELRQERDSAQAQEAAPSEVLEVINRSPGDLGSVFDAILEKALRLCGAGFGTLYTFDGKRFRAAAMRLRRVPGKTSTGRAVWGRTRVNA